MTKLREAVDDRCLTRCRASSPSWASCSREDPPRPDPAWAPRARRPRAAAGFPRPPRRSPWAVLSTRRARARSSPPCFACVGAGSSPDPASGVNRVRATTSGERRRRRRHPPPAPAAPPRGGRSGAGRRRRSSERRAAVGAMRVPGPRAPGPPAPTGATRGAWSAAPRSRSPRARARSTTSRRDPARDRRRRAASSPPRPSRRRRPAAARSSCGSRRPPRRGDRRPLAAGQGPRADAVLARHHRRDRLGARAPAGRAAEREGLLRALGRADAQRDRGRSGAPARRQPREIASAARAAAPRVATARRFATVSVDARRRRGRRRRADDDGAGRPGDALRDARAGARGRRRRSR